MRHFRRRRPVAGAVLAVMGLLAGCGPATSEDAPVAPAFSGIVGSCAEVAAPAMDAVRDYTGELFSETVGFEETGVSPTRPGLAEKQCAAAYTAPAALGASQSIGSPNRRVVDLRIVLRLGDDPVRAAERHIDSACESIDCRVTTGLGDESFDGAVEGSTNTAVTVFRTSNAVVTVTVAGTDFSSRPGEPGRDAAISELAPGARAVAEAIAGKLDAVVI